MTRDDIRAAILEVVDQYGIMHVCEWSTRPPALLVSLGENVYTISARAGMSKKALGFELGKLDTLARIITGKHPAAPRRKRLRQTDLEQFTGAAA